MCSTKAIFTAGLLLVLLFSTGCAPSRDFDHKVNAAVKSYRFSIAGWEFQTFFERAKQLLSKHTEKTQNDTETISEYISLGNRIKNLKAQINDANRAELQSQINGLQEQQTVLASAVEQIIKRQTTQVLSELGIYQPWYRNIKLKITFPPPDFKLEEMPHLLVISPRDKIETMQDVLLVKDLSQDEMLSIEDEVDKLDVSSLVVDLGGVGTYPNLVASDSDFNYILETCAHEWAHAYLAFTPLGFRYVLNIAGLSDNPDIDTMNETVADIIGKEIGAIVTEKYYPQLQTASQSTDNRPQFDFDGEMREIRKKVDQYLAAGEIEAAEKYMDEQRDYLAANGYYIRKLNQAYFAFNGKYADTPAFENPTGVALNQLRAKSASLSDFLVTASKLTSLQDLQSALEKAGPSTESTALSAIATH
ncbi:MAG: hypothetical protein PHY28_08445 [Dehalococcoidales bacterium]|nr:hypothetical protein [Dehalococcoidales bacterium]